MLCNYKFHYTKNELTWANDQTRAIQIELLDQTRFTTKVYFCVTIHMNSKTLGFKISIHSSIHRFTFGTRISWPFPASHTSQYNLKHTFHHDQPKQPTQYTHCHGHPIWFHNFFSFRFEVLEPIKRPFKASNQPKHDKILK